MYKCSECGTEWADNYCPNCARTIRAENPDLNEQSGTPVVQAVDDVPEDKVAANDSDEQDPFDQCFTDPYSGLGKVAWILVAIPVLILDFQLRAKGMGNFSAHLVSAVVLSGLLLVIAAVKSARASKSESERARRVTCPHCEHTQELDEMELGDLAYVCEGCNRYLEMDETPSGIEVLPDGKDA